MTRARVLVLGASGMLGWVVTRVLSTAGHDVRTLAGRYDAAAPEEFMAAVTSTNAEVVVNAIGLIKQKSGNLGDLLAMNGAFPLQLRLALPRKVLLIQPSTDCVFSSAPGAALVDDLPNATDAYGLSKSLGESVARYPATLVVRTSIVGPERGNGNSGLLGWFLSTARGSTIRGFTNHYWNGVTTLEWSRIILDVLSDHTGYAGEGRIIQPGTAESYTKAEMLRLFSDIFHHPVVIEETEEVEAADRRLVPTHVRPPLHEQLADLKAWLDLQDRP